MFISDSVKYIGVNDKKIDLFEGQYNVPLGMAYNSYLIIDEKCAVMDSVGAGFGEDWLASLKSHLGTRSPDYLIVQHMEPDHSSEICRFMSEFPDAKIVASQKAFAMISGFFGEDFAERRIIVAEGSSLSLGEHTLKFFTAPMVHWPEVIVTYEESEKILFSADAFGKFGALDTEDEWACEARRYYFGIVGKYGAQVQSLLKKLSPLEIKKICPLHGPVLSEKLDYYIGLYNTWSSYEAEERGVLIAYSSIYGNTKSAAELLYKALSARGVTAAICDLARCDMHEAVEDAFRYSHLVLASPTYNGDIFPPVKVFIDALVERNYRKRTVGFIENGTWAPLAAKVMRGLLEGAKDLSYLSSGVKILSGIKESNISEIEALAEEITKTI